MSTSTSNAHPFAFIFRFLNSSIGSKVLMAVTGIILWGFLFGHMLGNMQIFAPIGDGYWGKTFNEYGHTLKTTLPLLWGTRVVVLLALIGHAFFGLRLTLQNRAARPVRYEVNNYRQSTFWARFMPVSGIVLIFFIVFHLMHFTVGFPNTVMGINAATLEVLDAGGLPNAANAMLLSFKNIGFVAIYVISMLFLMAHLIHGAQSVWQSLGLHHRSFHRIAKIAGWSVAALIIAGFISIPVTLHLWATSGFTG